MLYLQLETPCVGLYSLSGRMSYCKIPWSLGSRKIGCFNYPITFIFDRHIGNAVAEVPLKFLSNWKSLDANLAASRLNGSCSKTSVCLVNRGPGGSFMSMQWIVTYLCKVITWIKSVLLLTSTRWRYINDTWIKTHILHVKKTRLQNVNHCV